MDLIFGLSIVCATLFGLLGTYLLVTKKGNAIANRFLGIFFLLWAIDFFDGALMLNGYYLEHPNWALWTESFLFLYGPLIYFYTLYVIDENRKFKFNDLIHFVLFCAGFIAFLKIYHLNPLDFKQEIVKGISSFNLPTASFITFLLVYAHFFFYIFISYRIVKKTIRNFENHYSYTILQWLQKLLLALALILILAILSTVLQFLGAKFYFIGSLILILLIMGILIGRLILKTLEQQSPMLPALKEKKYSTSDLKDSEASDIEAKILDAITKDEIYLDPELSLEQLSERIGIAKRKVSQVINARLGKSFFDLINTHRIDKAKHIFIESKDPKLTVLEVLYAVGFNSKSSFNTQFKARTGLTPSEFQKVNF